MKRFQQYFSMKKLYFVVCQMESTKLSKISFELKICLLEIPLKYQCKYARAHSLRNTSCLLYNHFKGKNYSNCLNSLQDQLTLTNYLVCRKCNVARCLVWTSIIMIICVNIGCIKTILSFITIEYNKEAISIRHLSGN